MYCLQSFSLLLCIICRCSSTKRYDDQVEGLKVEYSAAVSESALAKTVRVYAYWHVIFRLKGGTGTHCAPLLRCSPPTPTRFCVMRLVSTVMLRTLCRNCRKILISLMAVTGKPFPSPSSCLMHFKATSFPSEVRVALYTCLRKPHAAAVSTSPEGRFSSPEGCLHVLYNLAYPCGGQIMRLCGLSRSGRDQVGVGSGCQGAGCISYVRVLTNETSQNNST